MNANSTHRSVVLLSVVILCLLSATTVFADGPSYTPKKPPVDRPSPNPPATPTITPEPKPRTTPTVAGPVYTPTPTPPPQPPKTNWWWWISAAILLFLLLFILFWILRRRKPTGYGTPPPSRPTGTTYPVDQSPGQTRPDQY